MKILFVRHGESTDDLDNQYGGWGDFPLTSKGKIQLDETAGKIAEMDEKFDIVLSSPLQRAQESAKIIAEKLALPFETLLYLKEKNGYGLLSGLNKDDAQKNYPELVEMLESGYAPGAEPAEEFENRVKISIEKLKSAGFENIIAVTHGGYLTKMVEILFGKELVKKGDGGFVLIDFSDENPKVILQDGIEF